MNNFVHESVGSQKTSAEYIDMPKLFSSNNYNKVFRLKPSRITSNISRFYQFKWSKFLEMQIKAGSRKDLGRPTIKPVDNKEAIQAFLKENLEK